MRSRRLPHIEFLARMFCEIPVRYVFLARSSQRPSYWPHPVSQETGNL